MAASLCSTCHRFEGSLNPRPVVYNIVFYPFWLLVNYILQLSYGNSNSESREVSLASIHSTATSCKVCSFVQESLARDKTTPKKIDSSYGNAKVRVEDDGLPGLRFTGQWQGALVVEIYTPGRVYILISEKTI